MNASAEQSAAISANFERRFGGVGRLYGAAALARFQAAHVAVIGLGGVGSWVAEALARSAIGHMTLIDLDMVAESNVNRQIQALGDTFGKAKTEAMAERIRSINPDCRLTLIEDFISCDNVSDLLDQGFSYVVDAIDEARVKAAMIACCHRQQTPIITSGGAGGQLDPSQIQITDLVRSVQDPLLARVRSLLRKEYGFSRDLKKKWGVPAVFSSEVARAPDSGAPCAVPVPLSGLNCAGYGSTVCVTATFGLFAASAVLRALAAGSPAHAAEDVAGAAAAAL